MCTRLCVYLRMKESETDVEEAQSYEKPCFFFWNHDMVHDRGVSCGHDHGLLHGCSDTHASYSEFFRFICLDPYVHFDSPQYIIILSFPLLSFNIEWNLLFSPTQTSFALPCVRRTIAHYHVLTFTPIMSLHHAHQGCNLAVPAQQLDLFG